MREPLETACTMNIGPDHQLPAQDAKSLPPPEPASSGAGNERQASERAEQAPSGWGHKIMHLLLALILLGVAILIAWYIYRQKTEPERMPPRRLAAPVEVLRVQPGDLTVRIRGNGSVRARRELMLRPQVAGQVLALHPELVAGGVIGSADEVIRLDDIDYALAVEQGHASLEQLEAAMAQLDTARESAEAQIAATRAALERVLAEASVARSEFARLYPDREPSALLAREPQLQEARARLQAAQTRREDVLNQRQELEARQRQARSQLELAQVNLGRTRIRLPHADPPRNMPYRVTESFVALGDVVQPGQPLASLYPVHDLEVSVPLEERQLRWLDLPPLADDPKPDLETTPPSSSSGINRASSGSPATLEAERAGEKRQWPGRVVRTEGRVDPRTRMTNVVIAAESAGSLQEPASLLLPGLFVDVLVHGKSIEQVTAIPRDALRGPQESMVWLAVDDTLQKKQIERVHTERATAYVKGLQEGDLVIRTRLAAPVEGMTLEIITIEEQNGTAEEPGNRKCPDHVLQRIQRQLGDLEKQVHRLRSTQHGEQAESHNRQSVSKPHMSHEQASND